MGFITNIASPFLNFLKKLVYQIELRKYREALRRNPQDHYLRARYAKFCLNNYFRDSSGVNQPVEAVNQYENIVHMKVLDLEVFYLLGKYYQGQNNPKAIEVYKTGIKLYNEFVEQSTQFRHDHVETAFSIALNLLALEANHADPELEKFFKTLRRTYLKAFLENKVEFDHGIFDSTAENVKPSPN